MVLLHLLVLNLTVALKLHLLLCRSREWDRTDRRQQFRSGSQERRRRRSREREDMFKGSLSEGMKAEQDDSDDEV